MSAPTLSVVLLTCNRKDRITLQLTSLKRQTLPAEVIVVDNGSEDGTAESIQKQFPDVRLVQMAENGGCAGRNEGIQEANGDLIVTLDDDVLLHREDELERIVRIFEQHPDMDAFNFKILDPSAQFVLSINWYHPRPREKFADDTFETDYISEGAVAFRREVFAELEPYPADFFISHEGYDLVYRMMNKGMKIGYSGTVEVVHHCDLNQRPSWRNSFYDARNYVWIIFKFAPLSHIPFLLAYRMATTFLFSFRRGHLFWWVKAMWQAFIRLGAQLKKRTPLTKQTLSRLKIIRRKRPGLAYKVKDFFTRADDWNRVLPKGGA